MKIVIIGSVAAGTSVAAKARRNSEELEISIYEKDSDISYSGCGLPYYISSENISRDDLTPRDADWFKKRYNVDIFTSHEVLGIDYENKILTIKNIQTGSIITDNFDKLVFATGATPFVPNILGIENKNIFTLRNVNSSDKILNFINSNNPQKATIIGSGFIGLEMVESLISRGMEVTLVEKANSVLPILDEDLSIYLEEYLREVGVKLYLDSSADEIIDNGKKINLISGESIETDMIILSVGVVPNVKLAEEIGVSIGESRAIKVNSSMKTNLKDVYAVGDCVESFSLITGKQKYVPLGSTANKMGRILGDRLSGGNLKFKGILGTSIVKVLDRVVAVTGFSESEAKLEGYEVETIFNIKPNRSAYNKSEELIIKGIADKKSGMILGAQIFGGEGVDKRIDIFAMAITTGMTVDELFHLDLAYAPPFATTKDPIMYTGMILDNSINGRRKLITPQELMKKMQSNNDIIVIDVRSDSDYEKGHIEGAINIPLAKLREKAKSLDKDKVYVTHCNKGTTGDAAQNVLLNLGFEKVYNISGGYKNYVMQKLRKG